MCDGLRDETTWTLKHRATGRPLVTPSGFAYIFSDESEASEFLATCDDAATLEIVAIPNPE